MPSNEDIAKAVAEVVKALISLYGWSQYGGNCPGCHHGPLMSRHIGVPLFGHTQVACPCHAARKQGRDTGCGCVWTRDE
jgi:hypothetical protein